MNKTIRFSLLTLLVMLCGTVFADSYTADFNTAITTSDHAFQVASNWRHIVSTYTNYWDEESYVSYSYSATAGVDGSGALSCSTNQNSNKTYDLLVTPVVKGTVTIAAKTTGNYYTPQLSFFKITDNGDGTFTRGDQITVDVSAINASDYTTITIPVAEAGERIGIRSSYVWLDNFTATDATIIPEKKITIASAVPTATTGILKWDQQANGKVLVSYTVTVTNVGDVDLTQGTEGFSVSIINRATGDVYGTVPVPQDLAKGETSEAFAVSAEVESTLWPNSYTYINMDLKENLFGSTVQRAQSTYNAYEPKFVFRAFDSSSTSSISTAESWGTITESTTKNFEIFNSGTAPLTIKSITLPEGFTSTNKPEIPEGGLVIAKGEKQALCITHNAAATGTFIGTLTIVYLDKDNAEIVFLYGRAALGQHDKVNAVAMFTKAILLDENLADAYLKRGEVLLEMGDVEGAAEDADWLMERVEGVDDVLLLKAGVLQAQNNDVAAIDGEGDDVLVGVSCLDIDLGNPSSPYGHLAFRVHRNDLLVRVLVRHDIEIFL